MGLKLTDLTGISSITLDDILILTNNPTSPSDAETVKITIADFFKSVPANTHINATLVCNVLRVRDTWTPSTSNTVCTKGKISYDSNYLYVATANNYVKRVALSSF